MTPLNANMGIEIHRLKTALRDIYEVYAGSEVISKQPDELSDYLAGLVHEMKDIAAEALREGKK